MGRFHFNERCEASRLAKPVNDPSIRSGGGNRRKTVHTPLFVTSFEFLAGETRAITRRPCGAPQHGRRGPVPRRRRATIPRPTPARRAGPERRGGCRPRTGTPARRARARPRSPRARKRACAAVRRRPVGTKRRDRWEGRPASPAREAGGGYTDGEGVPPIRARRGRTIPGRRGGQRPGRKERSPGEW